MDTLPDLSSAPEDPRWTFDLGQGFWFPRFIGGNENVVALGARRHDAPAAVAFLDAGTGERLAQVDSPDDRTEFRSCAIAESDASAACLAEGLTDDGQAVVFADLGNGSIRRSVPAADRAIVVAHRDRFFVVPERSARSRIEVYDREGGLAATLPYGEVYPRSGLVVSREEAGRDTERLVVRSMTTLAEVFRQEPRKVGHTGANPFPGGFAVDTDSGVDYFDSDGNPTTTVRGARLERAAPGGVLSTRLGPAGESILPILTDRDTTGNEKPLFVASPMSGKTLWRWMFDNPVVVFCDGGTVVIKRRRRDGGCLRRVHRSHPRRPPERCRPPWLGRSARPRLRSDSRRPPARGHRRRRDTVGIRPVRLRSGRHRRKGLRRHRTASLTEYVPPAQNASLIITATVPGSSASKTCSTSPGYAM